MTPSPESLEQLLELVPGYLFGTLDADELAQFEAALRDPAYAAPLAADLELMRETLERSVQDSAVTPPPSLRERLAQRIRQENAPAGEVSDVPPAAAAAEPNATTRSPRVPDELDQIRARLNAKADARDLAREQARDARAGRTRTPGPSPVDAAGGAPVSRSTPESRAVRVTPVHVTAVAASGGAGMPAVLPDPRGRARTAWTTAAVLAMGLAATVVVALGLRRRVQELELATRENRAVLARVEAKLGEKERTLATLLAGRGNVVLVNLRTPTPTGPGMQVFWNVLDGKAVVNAFGLAQVPSNRAYMLWLIRDGKPRPLKLFTPDESGRALVADVDLPSTTAGASAFAVTEESAQGAEAPTMTPFLVGTVGTR